MDIRQHSNDELSLMFLNDEYMYKVILRAECFITEVVPFIAGLGINHTTGQLEQLRIDWDNGEFNE